MGEYYSKVYNHNISYITSEVFLNENKWLSLFFWQEFEIKTKPKCFIPIEKKFENTQIT